MSEELEKRIIAHEGSKQFAYKDTRGYTTIGIGRNIDERCGNGLTKAERLYLLRNDLNRCRKQLSIYGFFYNLDEVRQEVLIEMCFNLGLDGLLHFSKMIAALVKKDYSEAVTEMHKSQWSRQIGEERLSDLTHRMKTGSYG